MNRYSAQGRVHPVVAGGLVLLALVVVFLVVSQGPDGPRADVDPLAPLVLPEVTWSPADLDAFLFACNADRLTSLEKALVTEEPAVDVAARIAAIKKDAVWHSSNVLEYPFKDIENVDYHAIVQWVAEEYEVPDHYIERDSTFVLERRVMERVFARVWDGLTPEQRSELISKIDPKNDLDAADWANMSGTSALAALSATTYFSGFAFYSAMSTALATAAGWVGVTLPITVYTTASSVVGFLSGPIGWVMIGLGTTAMLGRAELKETTAFVLQMHGLKVSALERSGWDIPEPTS